MREKSIGYIRPQGRRKRGTVDTVQDFFIKLGIKPRMHLWEKSIVALNNVIVRPTKIMNRADKKLGTFLENKVL